MGFFNRRIHTRQLQQGHAMFVGVDGSAFLVEVKDISKGGCRIVRPRTWPFNVSDLGIVYLFGDTGPVPSCQSRIAWYEDESVGLEFT
jgi:hypothetical protein